MDNDDNMSSDEGMEDDRDTGISSGQIMGEGNLGKRPHGLKDLEKSLKSKCLIRTSKKQVPTMILYGL